MFLSSVFIGLTDLYSRNAIMGGQTKAANIHVKAFQEAVNSHVNAFKNATSIHLKGFQKPSAELQKKIRIKL